MIEFAHFSRAVASLKSGVFLHVCKTPVWLYEAFGFSVGDGNGTWRNVLLSSETANAKIRKHAQIQTLGRMVEIIQTSLVENRVEARISDRPNSIEVYIPIYQELWLDRRASFMKHVRSI